MKKIVIMFGAMLAFLNVPSLYAGLTPEQNEMICKEKWGIKIKKVGDALKREQAYEKARPGAKEERTERIKVLKKMLPELDEAKDYCIENGHENASIAYGDLIYQYLCLHL
jgi:hypothetical protein